MANANDLHSAALALMAEMKKTSRESSAAETIKDYNERRKKATEDLKPVLVEMDARMKAGETFGGCDSMKVYCKTYKPKGMLGYARVRQILTGTSGNEGKRSSDWTGVKVGLGSRSVLDSSEPIDLTACGGSLTVAFIREREVKYTAKYDGQRSSLDYRENTPKKKNGHIDREADCTFTHSIKELHGEVEVEVWMEGATEKEIMAALIAKVKSTLRTMRLPYETAVEEINAWFKQHLADQKEAAQKRAEREAARKERNKKPPLRHLRHPNYDNAARRAYCDTRLSRKNTADKRHPVTCKKCIALQAAAPSTPPKTEHVLHAATKPQTVHARRDSKKARCSKDITKDMTVLDVADGLSARALCLIAEKVTCKNCQTSLGASARREAYYTEHPAERGWSWWFDNLHWRHADGRLMEKTPHKKEYTVYIKGVEHDSVVGVAQTYEEACAIVPRCDWMVGDSADDHCGRTDVQLVDDYDEKRYLCATHRKHAKVTETLHPAAQNLEKTMTAAASDGVNVPQQECPTDEEAL